MSNAKLTNSLECVKITKKDYAKCLGQIARENVLFDIIFLDPPYDTEFSTYAKMDFDKHDQIRLANYLKKTKAKFMLIIKNTEFIYNLYKDSGFYIKSFDKKYLVSFMNRNDKDVTHLMITNYYMESEK